jgi:hypothetical protein
VRTIVELYDALMNQILDYYSGQEVATRWAPGGDPGQGADAGEPTAASGVEHNGKANVSAG